MTVSNTLTMYYYNTSEKNHKDSFSRTLLFFPLTKGRTRTMDEQQSLLEGIMLCSHTCTQGGAYFLFTRVADFISTNIQYAIYGIYV